MGGKPFGIDPVLQKVGEGRRGKYLMSLLYQLFGTVQCVDQYLLVAYGGFVQIYLPIHQSSGRQVVLYRIDAFGFHYQAVVSDVEHLDDASTPDVALCDSRIE